MLVEHGAVRIVQDAPQLAALVGDLLADPDRSRRDGRERQEGGGRQSRSGRAPDAVPGTAVALASYCAGGVGVTGAGAVPGGGGVSSHEFTSSSALRSRRPAACFSRSTLSM